MWPFSKKKNKENILGKVRKLTNYYLCENISKLYTFADGTLFGIKED